MIDWQEASRKPVRTVLFMFVAGVVCVAAFIYYTTDLSFPVSLVIGLAAGVVLLAIGLRSVRDPDGVVARATGASRRGLVWAAVIGLALAVSGVALSAWQLAASAIPFAVLVAVFLLVRRLH